MKPCAGLIHALWRMTMVMALALAVWTVAQPESRPAGAVIALNGSGGTWTSGLTSSRAGSQRENGNGPDAARFKGAGFTMRPSPLMALDETNSASRPHGRNQENRIRCDGVSRIAA